MSVYKILFIAIFSCFCTMVHSQVNVDVKIDSVQLFIGEQTDITLNVSLDAKQTLQLPDIKNGNEIIPNVEVVTVHRPDTNLLNDGKRMEISQRYTVTAWDSSFYYLPPFEVKVDGKVYKSNALALNVYTVDIDTLHLDHFFPPYPIMEPPFSWDDWSAPVFAAFLVVFLFIICIVLYYHIVNGKPIVRIIRRKKVLPPHKVAMDEIQRIKADRMWAEEDSKEYYTQLTDTLRTYIRERYGFNAMEMTSSEIIEHLLNENDEEALKELRDIFTTADLVKFAKHSTLINENDANLMAAMEYVNQTKLEVDPNAKPEPEVIKETDQKRQTQVTFMKCMMAVLGMVAVGLLVWIIWRSADILM